MFLDGRPPLNVGVTSGGDLFGGTQVSFADVLGDKQFNFYVASVSQFRTIAGSYLNLSRRMQYAVQGFQQTTFFYGNADYYALSLGLTPFLDRDDSIATRTHHRRHAVRAVPAQPLLAHRAVGRRRPLQRAVRRSDRRGDLARLPDAVLRRAAAARRHVGAARRRASCTRTRCSASSGRSPAARCGSPTTRRRRAATCCPTRRSTSTPASTCASARRACSRCASRASRAGARTPTSPTSAATRRCAATSTCRSSASRASSPTPSSASR